MKRKATTETIFMKRGSSFVSSSVVVFAALLSGCVYTVRPSAPPQAPKFAGAPLPLRVAVVSAPVTGYGAYTADPTETIVAALRRAGLFGSVAGASREETPAADVVVKINPKLDRTQNYFFPHAFPFCYPLVFGCFPILPIAESFTAEFDAEVGVGKSYAETGRAEVVCKGPFACANNDIPNRPAFEAAYADGAAKLAADFLKDAEVYRQFARAQRAAAAAPSAESAPADSGAKAWWKQ
jgi:hypothetical protein